MFFFYCFFFLPSVVNVVDISANRLTGLKKGKYYHSTEHSTSILNMFLLCPCNKCVSLNEWGFIAYLIQLLI